MKTAKTRTNKNLRPKHKYTKKYLKHYYPFIPLFASIGFLFLVLLSPVYKQQNVLAVATNISPTGLLESTNEQRTTAGNVTLTLNEQLSGAAQKKAQDMVARNYWSHKTPEGGDPWTFIVAENYSYRKAGENLAYGFADSKGVVTGWMNSPSHRSNLLDKDFREVGFGIADSPNFNNGGPSTVVVALYAKPLPVNSSTNSTKNSEIHILGDGMTISTASLFTGSHWSIYFIGAVIGAGVMYLAIVHGNRLRKLIKKGEKFFIKHPLLDSAVISLIAVGVILLEKAGTIL